MDDQKIIEAYEAAVVDVTVVQGTDEEIAAAIAQIGAERAGEAAKGEED